MLLFETAVVIIQQQKFLISIYYVMQVHSLGSQNKTLHVNFEACSTETIYLISAFSGLIKATLLLSHTIHYLHRGHNHSCATIHIINYRLYLHLNLVLRRKGFIWFRRLRYIRFFISLLFFFCKTVIAKQFNWITAIHGYNCSWTMQFLHNLHETNLHVYFEYPWV